MKCIGIDLAWGAKNTSAAVVLDHGTLTAAEDALTDDASLLAFLDTHDDGGDLLVAIDAPTLVPNQTGRRPCESVLSRCLHRQEAGPHPANRGILAGPDGTVRGERFVAMLETRGIRHTPFLDGLSPCRAAFEVFPHPAHVALFGLEKTLKYKEKKGRTRKSRHAEFRRYVEYLEGLAQADPPLRLPGDAEAAWWRCDPATLTLHAQKRYEDALDALTCAYVALYRRRWGDERCPVVGDLTHGYIVTPATSAMKTCFDAASAEPPRKMISSE